jgi:hypothetical protein
MRPIPQRGSRFPALIFGLGLTLLLTFPFAYGKSSSHNSTASLTGAVSSCPTSDQPLGPLGADHWTDAHVAENVVAQWLTDSPGTRNVTVSRQNLVWVRELVASAARQAEVQQKQIVHPNKRFSSADRGNTIIEGLNP